MIADQFLPEKTAFLNVTLRRPESPTTGQWVGFASLAPGFVTVLVETQGFKKLSEAPPPILIPKDRDTHPVAFELRIEDVASRWIHIIVLQDGRTVGELVINDFSHVDTEGMHSEARVTWRRISEADLVLIARTAEERIEVCSPRDRASLDHISMSGFKVPTEPFKQLLATRLRALYDPKANVKDTARELKLVGVELAGCLPPELIPLLRRSDVRSIMLRHEDSFDFPIELCYLDDHDDPFFVGDRLAVCRWYLGVKNPPDIVQKRVKRIAFLQGGDRAITGDEELLKRLYPQAVTTLGSRLAVIDQVFKSSDFDLIHFTGHCRQSEKGVGGLEMADGSFLQLIEIGQLEEERAFAKAQPFVMLNACSSAQPYLGVTQRGSFAHRFVSSSACAVIGTLWPVSGPIANEFAESFYEALANRPIAQAFASAKSALTNRNHSPGTTSTTQDLARQVAARSYCLFANPDLQVRTGLQQ